jgi:tetratricopeptide (TPR) repeat protein
MEQLEKILKTLGGELIGDEKKSFEKELAMNPSLRESFELVAAVDKTLADKDLVNFVAGIKHAQEVYNQHTDADLPEVEPEHNRTKKFTFKRYFSAAAILLVFAVSSILYVNFSIPKTEKLYNQFYSKYESSLDTRSEKNEISNLILAIQLYDKGNYRDAISRFDALLQVDHNNTSAQFFMGLSYMELKVYHKAIQSFKAVLVNRDPAFMEHAEWYMSLCYIKINQVPKAAGILNQVAASNSFYRVRAADLLKKLQ